MSKKTRIAILGLGKIGEAFAENLLAKIQEHRIPIEIVAVADHHHDSPVALGFAQNGVKVFKDALDVVKLGEDVDIIFDLIGNSKVSQELRLRLIESRNRHSMIAPEKFAQLLWYFFQDNTSALQEVKVA
jgi:homoserine dehydrogenase